ncbi:MAG: 4-hydroxy-tetrahydrodipicolinate reductase [Oscillospiraceae bacterium]|nr:4-hydroxy-tetrahydrodipicolinate reductase [Oscillospiraceae bacterium]
MTRIILSGACGRMGQTVAAISDPSCPIVAGVDFRAAGSSSFPIYTQFNDVREQADVVVDFSHPDALSDLLRFSQERSIALVLATTGYTDADEQSILRAAEHIPIIHSANFSMGISVLVALVRRAAESLPGCDIEIIEAHHRMKADAPSGTALALAREIADVSACETTFRYGRDPSSPPRSRHEIGLHSVRGGTGAGEHEAIFLLDGETLTLKHQAQTRDIFAHGALHAAKWIVGRAPGLYGMSDMIRRTAGTGRSPVLSGAAGTESLLQKEETK